MYDPATPPPVLLNAAAETVRAFNHASQDVHVGWEHPGHAYDAVGAFAHLARMLGQAVEQTARPAKSTYSAGRLTVDGGGDPDTAMQQLMRALETAAAAATVLATSLDTMHSALSPMGARLDDESADEDQAAACAD